MFTQAKLIIYGIIATLLISAVLGCVWYFKWSQAEIKVLNENNTKLTIAVTTQKETIAAQQKDAVLKNDVLTQTNEDFQAARKENNALRGRLSKHNIGYLASSKPKTVGKILSNASNNAERCFEILTGSPLTADEKAATKPSKVNRECPSLANPNFKGNL